MRTRVTENRLKTKTRPKFRVIHPVFHSSSIAFYPIRIKETSVVAELTRNSVVPFNLRLFYTTSQCISRQWYSDVENRSAGTRHICTLLNICFRRLKGEKSNTEIFCRNGRVKSDVLTKVTKKIAALFDMTRCSVVIYTSLVTSHTIRIFKVKYNDATLALFASC